MVIPGVLLQRPHLFGRTRAGCSAWESLGERVLALLSSGRSPWHPYILKDLHLSGRLLDFPSSWLWPKLGVHSLPCGRTRKEGAKEVCQHQGEWPSPLLPPLAALMTLHLLLAFSSLLPLWSGVFLWSLPVGKWLAFRHSQY